MVYTLSYSNIHESEKSLGVRAVRMGKVANKNLFQNIFFIITSDALNKFIAHNSVKEKLSELLNFESEEDAWDSLKDFLSGCSFPDDVKREIRESYDALSVSGSTANNILRSFESRVNVFFGCDSDNMDNIFLNIKGFDNLLSAVKSCLFHHIKKEGVGSLREDLVFDCGVVIEKFVSSDFTVEVEVSSDNNLLISVYKGLPEVSSGIVKDYYVLSFNHLEFVSYELNHQNFSIIHQDDSGVLLKKRLGREGADNKISKNLVSECGRLAKRVFDILDEFVKVIFVVKKDIPYLFLINKSSDLEEVVSNPVDEVVSNPIMSEKVNNFLGDNSNPINDEADMFENDFVKEKSSNEDSDFVEESTFNNESEDSLEGDEKHFSDSDEFIVQGDSQQNEDENDFSSFFKLIELLEEDIFRMYKDSFGFNPSSVKDAIYELDNKHGFEDKNKIFRVLEVKSLIVNGEEVDRDIISSLCGVIEDFLRRDES